VQRPQRRKKESRPEESFFLSPSRVFLYASAFLQSSLLTTSSRFLAPGLEFFQLSWPAADGHSMRKVLVFVLFGASARVL
jgi:hypothetical protein